MLASLSPALAEASVTFAPSWELVCAPAGQNSTATFRLLVETADFSSYTIQTNVLWGDQFSYGKTIDLPVNETHELVYEYAFEARGSEREHVKMLTNWIAPDDAAVAPKDPMSQYAQIVDITEDECILIETDSPTTSPVPTSTPSPVGGGSSSNTDDLPRLLLTWAINAVSVSIALWLIEQTNHLLRKVVSVQNIRSALNYGKLQIQRT